MKVITAYIAFTIIVLVASFGFIILSFASKHGIIGIPDFKSVKDVSNLQRYSSTATYNPATVRESAAVGLEAKNDDFAVESDAADTEIAYEEKQPFELTYEPPDLSNMDADMTYKNDFSEEPLVAQDYYYRKYENGMAGANGINKIPLLHAGDSYGVIKNKFINIKSWNGFVQPPGYYFGSGVCWSTSALGLMMDNANKSFHAKYGVDLFVFNKGDRAPHPHFYKTYFGYGYTIMQLHEGVPLQDYRFTVNPQLSSMPGLSDIKIKIVMLATTAHPTASHGQSLGGYFLSNKEF